MESILKKRNNFIWQYHDLTINSSNTSHAHSLYRPNEVTWLIFLALAKAIYKKKKEANKQISKEGGTLQWSQENQGSL